MVYVVLAQGFEEIEALTPVDMLRRAEVPCKLIGVTTRAVCGSHGIIVQADATLDEVDLAQAEMLVLPGGMAGTTHLYEQPRVRQAVEQAVRDGRWVAAICAAPSVILGGLGLLQGRKATCYPGMEQGMTGAHALEQACVTDGNIITARGMGSALPFALTLVRVLCGEDKASALARAVVYDESE